MSVAVSFLLGQEEFISIQSMEQSWEMVMLI